MRQKIFDPFYSSHALGGNDRIGAGLGLSIVHGIVLNHKGHIEVESHLGMGSHFTIYLPISQSESDSRVVSLSEARATTSRVMLVDDEEWIVDVAARLLTSLGLEVEAFVHPLEALERFKTGPNDFSLLITDQNMPQMKGVELIDAVRKVRDDVNVVMMSGNVSPLPDDDPAYFMAKPFRLADLKQVLEKVGLYSERESKEVVS
jgi:CheY-like chemotaxis protein